jgi:hypothetical protein
MPSLSIPAIAPARFAATRQLDVMGDGLGVIAVHVLDHADFGLAGERVGQGQLVDPVNRAETADVAVAHRVEHPEIEIVGLVVVLRIGEIAVVTLGGGFDSRRLELCASAR